MVFQILQTLTNLKYINLGQETNHGRVNENLTITKLRNPDFKGKFQIYKKLDLQIFYTLTNMKDINLGQESW